MRGWMVRAGNENELIEDFARKGSVAIGFSGSGDLAKLRTRDLVKDHLRQATPDQNPNRLANYAGQLYRFGHDMKAGDWIVSYDQGNREYLVGQVAGPYRYDPGLYSDAYPHVRPVTWSGRVARAALSVDARNSLGATQTVFEISDYIPELEAAQAGKPAPAHASAPLPSGADYFREVQERAEGLIIDNLDRLDGYDFEALVAGLLRAMGYKTQENPRGPDGGIDIRAGQDGLLLSDPIIRVQVKHRKGATSSPEIQQLVGAMGGNARGLFISTGGFTKDARREADRAAKPVTLLDGNRFVELLLEYYERLDIELRDLVPLRRVWLPARA